MKKKALSIVVFSAILIVGSIILSAGIREARAQAQPPCYTYSVSESGPQTTINLIGGKIIQIPNQSTPSILQAMVFPVVNVNYPCVMFYNYTEDRMTYYFVTPGNTLINSIGPLTLEPILPLPPGFNPSVPGPLMFMRYRGIWEIGGTELARIQNEDAIINSIGATRNFAIRIGSNRYPLTTDMSVPATNCALISGAGPKKVVFMRGKSWSSSINDFLFQASEVIDKGFKQVDPFKSYVDQFSFYVDLKKVDDTAFAVNSSLQFIGDADNSIFANGSCGSGAGKLILYLHNRPGVPGAYSTKASSQPRISYLNPAYFAALPSPSPSLVTSAIHEIGHLMGYLQDEYSNPFLLYDAPSMRNCTDDPARDYRDQKTNHYYGSPSNYGCGAYTKDGSVLTYHIPSSNSILNNNSPSTPDYNLFNVISCGYLISAIKGEPLTKVNALTHWPQCMTLATTKDGVPPVAPAASLVSIKQQSPGKAVITGLGFTATGNSVQFVYKKDTSKIYETTDIPSTNSGTVLTFAVPKDMPPNTLFEEYSVKVGALNSDWSNELSFPALPQLGFFKDELAALKTSVAAAKDSMQNKRNEAFKNVKGGQMLTTDPLIDGPLYLLQEMEKNLVPDSNGSLDSVALLKFFTRLKALRAYNNSVFSDVISRADALTGFSYLFPFSVSKPLLIYVPGAGGDPMWRGGLQLLIEETSNFNIVGYTYDATQPPSVMRDTILKKFADEALDSTQAVVFMMSLGNTLLHSAILQTISAPEKLFSRDYVVSVGFIPGGSSKFLGKPKAVLPIASFVFPPYAEIFNAMNPANPLQTSIAGQIAAIHSVTKGIHYIQANNDDHINRTDSTVPYATNRDLIFGFIKDKVTYVSPPEIYEIGNSHVNLLYAPEVKTKIDYYRSLLLQQKTSSSATQSAGFSFTIPKWVSQAIRAARDAFNSGHSAKIARAQTPPLEPETELFNAFFGNPIPNICPDKAEILRDSIILPGMDYSAYASAIKNYLQTTNSACKFDSAEQLAVSSLQPLPLSESIPVSGTLTLAFTLDFTGVSSVDLAVDGSVVSTGTTSPWNLFFASTNFTNGNHSVNAILRFPSPKPPIATRVISIQINNPVSSIIPLITSGGTASTLRNDFAGWVGTAFKVGSSPITVTELGRYVVSGSSGSHAMKLVKLTDGSTLGEGIDVPGASVTINLSGKPAGAFAYAALPSPVTLSSNATYFLVSQEVLSGDKWYDYGGNNITFGAVVLPFGATWASNGSSKYVWANTGAQTYGPVNLKYVSTVIPVTYALSVAKSGTSTGMGTITSNPIGISCGSTCSYSFASNASVTLTATPASGSSFSGWSGACSGTSLTCTVSMTAAKSVTAAFTLSPLPPSSTATPLITSGGTASTLRNDFAGWVGTAFKVGSSPITVTELGRYVVSGSSGSHAMKLVKYSGDATGADTDVPGGSVIVNLSGKPAGAFAYATLPSPIILSAGSTYFLMSQETSGSIDKWYDYSGNTITFTSAVSPVGPTYAYPNSLKYSVANPNVAQTYGPVNLKYTAGSSVGDTTKPTVSIISPTSGASYTSAQTITLTASATDNVGITEVDFFDNGAQKNADTVAPYTYNWTITASQNGTRSFTAKAYDAAGNSALSSPVSLTVSIPASSAATPLITSGGTASTLRNDFAGWVGFGFKVGSTPITVTDLGRYVLSGSSGSHTVKLVKYVDGSPTGAGTNVSGGSVTVNTAGIPAGTYAYATLPAPVTLQAGSTYFLLSQEVLSGDKWYDYWNNAITLAPLVSPFGPTYAYNNSSDYIVVNLNVAQTYGPVNLKYTASSPPISSKPTPSRNLRAIILEAVNTFFEFFD